MGTCMQYSLDFCLAWALIGEWTSRVLFPVPKGPWPRHGHAGELLQKYQTRAPRIVAWARAAFEQGALPSLLMMPGLALVLSLPGDRMFQATQVTTGCQRPAIMHAYGGAKVGMARSLASIASEGWLPMAAAMLGTADKPPMWASVGLRPVVGTTIDFRVLPPVLSDREKLLLLSCWQQWDPNSVTGSAISQWLVGIDVEHGPDGLGSPTYLEPTFNVQEAADLYQAVHLHTLEAFAANGPYPQVISQLALRIITYEYPLEAILATYVPPATGHLSSKFPHDQWVDAARRQGDTKIAAIIHTEAEWADAKTLLSTLENVEVEAESRHGAVVWSSAQNDLPAIPTDSFPLQLAVLQGTEVQRHLPETLHVEATGLGGRDLSYPIPWDISIRSDKEGQSVYGPSLAPMEDSVAIPGPVGGSQTIQITALGRTKASHEFLVLHYFGVDSAKHWDVLMSEVLPAVQLPGASARRATALECLKARTSHRHIAECLMFCGPTL